jgi:hypothetical protein|tara:strand:- start:8 stop:190 length:183 start_codon:yes stop_codon:yes gene_type:complete
MNMLSSVKDWILARWSERTSWDGGVIVAVSLSLIILGDLVWWAAWLALAYGVYTLVKPEV